MIIRLGLIGCGEWGVKYLTASDTACSYLKFKEGDSRALKRIRKSRFLFTHVSRVKAEIDMKMGGGPILSSVERVSDWRRMVDLPIDGFVVATPPSSHAEICEYLLSRGKPVMVEKPLTLDLNSTRKLIAVARKSGVPFLVNHVHLFSPAYERLREIVIAHRGPITILSKVIGYGPFRDYSALLDYGPHDISMTLGLNRGYPRLIAAYSAKYRKGSFHQLELEFPRGSSKAILRLGNGADSLSEKQRQFEIIGKDLWLSYDGTSLFKNGQLVHTKRYLPLDNAVTQFVLAIMNGTLDWRFAGNLSIQVAHILDKVSNIHT